MEVPPELPPKVRPPLPIRYKKEHEITYWVNTVDGLSDETFSITMPVDLNLHDRILFEIFDGGSQIAGVAEVIWISEGNTGAACRVLSHEKRNHLL